jgi:hypothetical protein
MPIKYRVEGLGTALDALRDIGTDVKTMRKELRPAARTLASALREETPKRSSALASTVRPSGTVRQRAVTSSVGSKDKPYALWNAFGKRSPNRFFHNAALYGRLKQIENEIALGIQRIIAKHTRR